MVTVVNTFIVKLRQLLLKETCCSAYVSVVYFLRVCLNFYALNVADLYGLAYDLSKDPSLSSSSSFFSLLSCSVCAVDQCTVGIGYATNV